MRKDAPGAHQDHEKQNWKMVNNSLAILPGLQNDVTRLIRLLLLSALQSLPQFPAIATIEPYQTLC
jgi:hypothetical protein